MLDPALCVLLQSCSCLPSVWTCSWRGQRRPASRSVSASCTCSDIPRCSSARKPRSTRWSGGSACPTSPTSPSKWERASSRGLSACDALGRPPGTTAAQHPVAYLKIAGALAGVTQLYISKLCLYTYVFRTSMVQFYIVILTCGNPAIAPAIFR